MINSNPERRKLQNFVNEVREKYYKYFDEQHDLNDATNFRINDRYGELCYIINDINKAVEYVERWISGDITMIESIYANRYYSSYLESIVIKQEYDGLFKDEIVNKAKNTLKRFKR